MPFYFIPVLLAVLGGGYALIHFQKLSIAFKWLGVYLFVAGIVQVVAIYLKYRGISNTPLYNVAIFVYHFLLFMFFWKLPIRKYYKRIIAGLFLISTFGIFYFISVQYPVNWTSFRAIVLANLVYILSALLGLLNILRSAVAENPLKNSRFLAYCGILFYFTTSAVYFIATNFFVGKITPGLLAYFNLILLVLFYSFLIVVFRVEIKQNQIHGIER